uniref:Uncharacterized protein n=1 Tax=Arundo donax TaxID=35708 RepID=A0A0A9A8J6_ARUDO
MVPRRTTPSSVSHTHRRK